MYKKILLILLLGLCFNVVGCSNFFGDGGIFDNNSVDLDVITWPETKLTSVIPKPNSKIGKIESLTNDEFIVYIGNTTQEYFGKYVNECLVIGFNLELTYSKSIFYAKNNDGYTLYMKYSKNIMYIRVLAPDVLIEDNTYRLGMGIVVDLGHASNASDVQVDSTVASVVLDKEGKIVACRIDALQNIATISGGLIVSKNTTSKVDKGDSYGMSSAVHYGLDPNNDGVVKEWYEQARAFEEYVVGKTGVEVSNLETQTNYLGYQMSADETLLAAGCTIQITDFIVAVVKACNDDQSMEFTTSDEFTLGIAVKGYLDSSSSNADYESNGEAKLYSDYACSVVVDGEIVAALNDSIQPRVIFSIEGGYGEIMYSDTKRELKENYNMAHWGLDQNGDGIVKEWYLQSAEFSKFVVGMTAAEVLAMPLQTINNGYIISNDSALLAAGCTIQITSMQAVVAASVTNAR